MIQRNKVWYTIIAIILSVVFEVIVCKIVTINVPMIIIAILMYLGMLLSFVESFHNVIKKLNFKNNIMKVIWTTAMLITITMVQFNAGGMQNDIISYINICSLLVFSVISPYKLN